MRNIILVLVLLSAAACGDGRDHVGVELPGSDTDNPDAGVSTPADDAGTPPCECPPATPDAGVPSTPDTGVPDCPDASPSPPACTPEECDDGDACTNDACDPAVGCKNSPVDCDDGDPCTVVDVCQPSTGQCIHSFLACEEGYYCQGGECVCDGDADDASDGECDDGKTIMCHYPPGDPNNAHEVCVDESAVPAHESHGDTAGECVCDPEPTPECESHSDCLEEDKRKCLDGACVQCYENWHCGLYTVPPCGDSCPPSLVCDLQTNTCVYQQ